jgi:hypothetical protein
VSRLIDRAVEREMVHLERDARLSNELDAFTKINARVSEAKLQLERLREPSSRFDAAGQLLGWLHEMAEERND